MNFKDTLFAYVQFAFDNERDLLRYFIETEDLPNANNYVGVIDCDCTLNEFFMSGSLCLLDLEYFDKDDEWRTITKRISTRLYLDWVESKGGLPDESV